MVFPMMNFKWKRQREVHKMVNQDTSIPQTLVSRLHFNYYYFLYRRCVTSPETPSKETQFKCPIQLVGNKLQNHNSIFMIHLSSETKINVGDKFS